MADDLERRVDALEGENEPDGPPKDIRFVVEYYETILNQETGERHEVWQKPDFYETTEADLGDGRKMITRWAKFNETADHGVLDAGEVTQ